MKKGLIFATTLAMALGVGAAVGAQQQARVAKAGVESVSIAGSFNTWAAEAMTLDGDYYTFTREFEKDDEFKVVVPGTPDDYWVSANWNGVTNSTEGGIVDGGGEDHNFKVETAAKYTVKAVKNIAEYGEKGYGVTVEKYQAPEPADVPAEDGYYLVGTESNWKYAGATKMDAGQGTDKAQLIGYEAKAGEIFKVRSYFEGVNTWYGSNYEVGESARTLDIYLNQYDEVYVEDHPTPVVQYDYKMQIVGKENLITLIQSEEQGKESEYFLPAEYHFNFGESVKFFKVHEDETTVLATEPKEDGQLTKVYVSDPVNHVLTFAQEFDGKLMLDISTNYVWAGQFEPGYYLAGIDGQWNEKLATPATKVSESDPAYVVEDVVLSENEEVQFIQAPEDGNAFEWCPAAEDKVGTQSEVKFEVVTEGLEAGNLRVKQSGIFDIYYNPEEGYYSIEDTEYVPDIPAEEGYYICGEFSGNDEWRYDPNGRMTDTTEGGNVAYTMNFSLAAGDKMRVRSYFNDQEPKDRWAKLGNVIDEEDPERLFDKDGENIVARVAGYYDVYAKYESDDFVYYVAPHVESYDVTMVGVKYAGAAKETTFELAGQIAYQGDEFEPALHDQSGYVTRGVYTDEACTTEYVKQELSQDTTLYVKYTKVGFYALVGASEYSVDGAKLMDTEGIGENNKAEVYLAGVKANDTYSFVYYDGGMSGQSGLGANVPESVAVYEEGHVKFVADGNYAIYFGKDNLVYINAGLAAYLTNFLTQTGAECKGNDTDLDKLAAVWEEQEAGWSLLSNEEKARISNPSTEDELKDLIAEMTTRYVYIVEKYGTAKFHDFIWERDYSGTQAAITSAANSLENSVILYVVVGASVLTLAGLALLVVKHKRKEDK